MPIDEVLFERVYEDSVYKTQTLLFGVPIGRSKTNAVSSVVKKISGLDSVDVEGLFNRGSSEISVFNGIYPQTRKIVLRVGLEPYFSSGETYADVRQKFYELMSLGVNEYVRISFRFKTVNQFYVGGYVKRIESDPFSDDNDVLVHFESLSPWLMSDPTPQTTINVGVAAPFLFTAKGNAPSPFMVQFRINSNTQSINCGTGQNLGLTILPPDSFLSGDVITIDTNPQNPKITRKRGGSTLDLKPFTISDSDILPRIYKPSTYVTVQGGNPTFLSGTVTNCYWGY